TRLVIDLPPDQLLDQGTRAVAISPDGNIVVYAATRAGRRQLFTRRLDEFVSNPVPGSEDGSFPAFSPDGTRVVFYTPNKLKTITMDGRTVRELASLSQNAHNAVFWGEDHYVYYSSEPPKAGKLAAGIWRVPDDGS